MTRHLESFIRYIMSIRDDIKERDLCEVLEKNSKIGSEIVMSLAERLRQEGRLEGRREGQLEGRQEGQLNVAINMIRLAGTSLTQAMEIAELPSHMKMQLEMELKRRNMGYKE